MFLHRSYLLIHANFKKITLNFKIISVYISKDQKDIFLI